jgi:hypothetical protein
MTLNIWNVFWILKDVLTPEGKKAIDQTRTNEADRAVKILNTTYNNYEYAIDTEKLIELPQESREELLRRTWYSTIDQLIDAISQFHWEAIKIYPPSTKKDMEKNKLKKKLPTKDILTLVAVLKNVYEVLWIKNEITENQGSFFCISNDEENNTSISDFRSIYLINYLPPSEIEYDNSKSILHSYYLWQLGHYPFKLLVDENESHADLLLKLPLLRIFWKKFEDYERDWY